MRKTIIAGNWKMYKTIPEAIELANEVQRELFDLDNQAIDVVLCPPFTALTEVSEAIATSNCRLGAQDMYWQAEGAFTGEISGKMLKDAGCDFVIIGHSERRQYFGETNEGVNKKVKSALSGGLTPIMCVGETLEQREKGLTFEVLKDHVQNGLKDITAQEIIHIVVAYEPVWAIGTGKTATPQQAQEAQKHIRGLLAKLYNPEIAEGIRIQYGGSIKPDNIAELMRQPDVDGGLVGGASLTVESFVTIVKKASEVKK
jgi:triosephosphate isomerase